MPYRRLEVELSEPLRGVTLMPDEDGIGLLGRWRGALAGFAMIPCPRSATVDADQLRTWADERFSHAILQMKAAEALEARFARPALPAAPSLTVAICTKDRAPRLERLLRSLDDARDSSPFSDLEIVVVDNAPSDESTREAVARVSDVRYVREPLAGLDFARNAALRSATGDILAFLDDDVVIDPGYFAGLYRAWRDCPDAGGFTGLVLPFRLDTEAQTQFEKKGGFGRGFLRTQFRLERFGMALHPVGAGILGAGCNMAFDRRLLLELGGFDEALDTGAPLPGGGDLDIFYRVLRAGRTMAYEPSYAVFHEHRETLPQLERQYWTWGLGFMAFLEKSRRTDPALRGKQRAIVWWWMLDRLAAVGRSAARGRRQDLAFAWAELKGGLQGMVGEYDRSRRRSQHIRESLA